MGASANEKSSKGKRNFFNKRDIIIVAALLLMAGAGLFASAYFNGGNAGDRGGNPEENKLTAVIYFLDVEIQSVNLDEDQVIYFVLNPEIQFEVKDGSMAFIHSDCPDQLCVGMGWQDMAGGFAACLPNQVMFFIDTAQETELDAIVR